MKTAVRRVLLMSALLSPSALYALGLGEIRLNSALNQPFDAEIELVSAAQEDLAALRASLASSDTFVRYGLDRPAYLSDFTFQVVRSDGRDVLRITSPKPVTEPFVTLLVEANWPRGRLLREYTVLLDPPVFAPEAAATPAAVAAPRVASAPSARPAAVREPVAAAPAPSQPEPSRRVAAAAIEPGSTYRVRPNDTLWQIASAAYPGSRSDVNRAMVAIYQSNPGAFGGNINVLRAGSDLRMPSGGDVSAISTSAAADEVARQYRQWREGAAAASADSSDGGRLRLVTPEQGSAAPSTATTAATAAADSGLQARVQQLEAELAEARRLLEVRNAELATLQGGVAPVTEPGVPADAGSGEPADAVIEPTDSAATEDAATPEPIAEPAAEPEPAPEPEARPAPAEAGPSLFDRLREYWWVLLGLLAAALGIAFLLRRRQASSTAEEELEQALGRRNDDLRTRIKTPVAKEPSILVEERKPVEPAPARAAPAVAAAAGGQAPEPSRRPVSIEDTLSGEGPVSIEAGDPLAEADFHMAYGLYDQAADLVQVAAKREPQRRDLKLKLLEIFFVWGNKDRFLEVARELDSTRGNATPGEWDKVLIMGRQLAPDEPLFAAGTARATPDSLDMELSASDAALDMELIATKVGTLPDVDLTGTAPRVEGTEGSLDFELDEPVRGEDDSLGPTVETPRVRTAASEEPTTELPIEDLGLDAGDFAGLDETTDLESELGKLPQSTVEDTIERQGLSNEEDLLSSTSIMSGDTIAAAMGEPEPGVVDLSEATGELPTIEAPRLEATGIMQQPDFGMEGEAATMSEVGTKLDLARAYIDMGDPEGARSILDEVLKEGNANQRKEAERLLAGLP